MKYVPHSDRKKYLDLLSEEYPSIASVCTEIINLRAILELPKGTEHFLSDLHGEYEAFTHILNNCSGVIREKVDALFSSTMSEAMRAELCTLIYYPEEKLEQLKERSADLDKFYEATLQQLIELCRVVASKYTRSKVRKAMPPEFAYIIDELLHADYDEENRSLYYHKITESILALNNADAFIQSIASLIKRLAVDRLHIVGDLYDRGPRPDLILDMLIAHHSVDIQWGNHDILWMGAAAGSRLCIAEVVCNCAVYGNFAALELGYGINLRPLALFAEKTYAYSAVFAKKTAGMEAEAAALACKMHKAIAIIQFKLEGEVISRNPQFAMQDRLLLHRIRDGAVEIDGVLHPLLDADFPTLDPADPYALTEEENRIIDGLARSFLRSEKLQRHVQFLYANGGFYRCYNHNLLFHGCIPMEEDGSLTVIQIDGEEFSGRRLLDRCEKIARRAYFGNGPEKQMDCDWMWYFWCGRNSSLFGRDKMATFERLLIADEQTWTETKNHYYRHILDQATCERILAEFGLFSHVSHIINGHVPVRAADGENPVKANGRLIVIDGGFCRAYQRQTGIAGYTLIYNSHGMRLVAHTPFQSIQSAIENNTDIHSISTVFETLSQRMKVMDMDVGQDISERIYDLSLLLTEYRKGNIKPRKV